MRKIFEKDEVWFAVIWILIYVIGFSNADALSSSMGYPKLLTAIFGAVLAYLLYGFIRKNNLKEYYGFNKINASNSNYIFFIPLFVISSVNFWNGVSLEVSWFEAIMFIISMCLVGFIEETLFRGLLFKGMAKSNVNSAIIVSSLTFGMGHIVNLLVGKEFFSTLMQLIYASAIGFTYTAIFYTSGSIIPCVLSHAFINSTSLIGIEPSAEVHVITTIVLTILGFGYGIWLLKTYKKSNA